jgi:ribosomal-protein-alanine N-acetyltransferase
MPSIRSIEIRQVGPEHVDALGRFFETLRAHNLDNHFHPHPLTLEAARERGAYRGKDLYFILLEVTEVAGYAMLRGWDEGYEIPSVGIAVHPIYRGLGIGKLLLGFLHLAAIRRGAEKTRLTVHLENHAALSFYRSYGYTFAPSKNDRSILVGHLSLRIFREAKVNTIGRGA